MQHPGDTVQTLSYLVYLQHATILIAPFSSKVKTNTQIKTAKANKHSLPLLVPMIMVSPAFLLPCTYTLSLGFGLSLFFYPALFTAISQACLFLITFSVSSCIVLQLNCSSLSKALYSILDSSFRVSYRLSYRYLKLAKLGQTLLYASPAATLHSS